VPRIFEKLYTLAQGQIPAPVIAAISDLGGQIRDLEYQGEPVPQELQDPLDRADRGRRAGSLTRADQRVREGPVRREPA